MTTILKKMLPWQRISSLFIPCTHCTVTVITTHIGQTNITCFLFQIHAPFSRAYQHKNSSVWPTIKICEKVFILLPAVNPNNTVIMPNENSVLNALLSQYLCSLKGFPRQGSVYHLFHSKYPYYPKTQTEGGGENTTLGKRALKVKVKLCVNMQKNLISPGYVFSTFFFFS